MEGDKGNDKASFSLGVNFIVVVKQSCAKSTAVVLAETVSYAC